MIATRRTRWPAYVAVLLLLGFAAAVVTDRLACATAQERLASNLQPAIGARASPTVTFGGFPFLTQAAAHTFTDVLVTAPDATLGGVPVTDVTVKMGGVKTDPTFTLTTAASVSGSATISWSELSTRAHMPMAFASPDRMTASVSTEVMGTEVTAVITAKPGLDASGAVLLLEPSVSVAGLALPQALAGELLGALLHPIPVPLPDGLKPTAIASSSTGLTLTFSGTNVDLTALR